MSPFNVPSLAWFTLPALILSATACGAADANSTVTPQVERCDPALHFLEQELGMVAQVESEVIPDWRTWEDLPGCRITAGGITTLSLEDQAVLFFQRLRSAGWTRTPDPRDAPGEAMLRFRLDETDCLFSVYPWGLLLTEAEREVNMSLEPGPGEDRFNVLVQCMPAMEAAPD